jgi:hypothetical protein
MCVSGTACNRKTVVLQSTSHKVKCEIVCIVYVYIGMLAII